MTDGSVAVHRLKILGSVAPVVMSIVVNDPRLRLRAAVGGNPDKAGSE
jgi:hypothetical protein